MLPGDNIEFRYKIHDLDGEGILILIKKESFMTKDYIKFLMDSMYKINVAKDIYYGPNVGVDNSGNTENTIALVLRGSVLHKDLLEPMLIAITSQFCQQEFYKKHSTNKKEVKKPYVDKETLKKLEAIWLDEINDSEEPRFSEVQHEKDDIPSYLLDHPVCPNVAIRKLREMYMKMYIDLVKAVILVKSKTLPLEEVDAIRKEIHRTEAIMFTILDELEIIEDLEEDCDKCENGICDISIE